MVLDYVFIFPLGMGDVRRGLGYLRGSPASESSSPPHHFLRGKQLPACPVPAERQTSPGNPFPGGFLPDYRRFPPGSSCFSLIRFSCPCRAMWGGGLWNHRESGADRGLHLHRRGPGDPAYRQPQLRQRTDEACEADLSLRRHHGGSSACSFLGIGWFFSQPIVVSSIRKTTWKWSAWPARAAPLFPRVSHDGR